MDPETSMSISSQILDKYGLVGLIVLFSVYVIKRILDFLMAASDLKDKTMKDVGERSLVSLDSNTKATNVLNDSVMKLNNGMAENSSNMKTMMDQNSESHKIIIEHLKELRAKV